MLKSTTRSINNHVEQSDELFSNAEHDAAKAERRTRSGGESHAARSMRPYWCRWKAIRGCRSAALETTALEQ